MLPQWKYGEKVLSVDIGGGLLECIPLLID
jgi:hypothetical protein